MALSLLIGIYIIFFGSLLFVLVYGEWPIFEGTFVQSYYLFITGGFFESLRGLVKRILGENAFKVYSWLEEELCEKANPLTQIFYLAIFGFGYFVFLDFCFDQISPFERMFIPLLLILGLLSFFLASFCNPGRISQSNFHLYSKKFPYDQIIYTQKCCQTCKIQKPARSKHCKICNFCISRFDHHCGWMNNCIGENNIRYFLLFLITHAIICSYGIVLLIFYFLEEIKTRKVLEAIKNMEKSKAYSWREKYSILAQWLMNYYSTPVMLLVLLVVLFFLLFFFLAYHVHLVSKNTTTNETYKWKDYSKLLKQNEIEVEKNGIVNRSLDDSAIAQSRSPPQTLKNIYNIGFWANWSEVIFLTNHYEKHFRKRSIMK